MIELEVLNCAFNDDQNKQNHKKRTECRIRKYFGFKNVHYLMFPMKTADKKFDIITKKR